MTEIHDLLIERPDRLQLYRFDELVMRPPAPWQIRGVLREQSVSLLYGRRGCYKSFVALDLAASLATGIPWQTHEITTKGLVIYVAGEGGGGMVQRARAWVEQHAIHPRDVNIRFVTEPVVCTASSEDMDILIHRIREAIDWQHGTDEETGHEYDEPVAREWPILIIIDTLARCYQGDENKQEDMGQFIQGVDRLKVEFNSSILILHHTGHDQSHERGSTALGGACDTIYKLECDDQHKTLSFINEKMKDGREPAPVTLKFREVAVSRRPVDDPDEDLTSVIIEMSRNQKAVKKTADILDLLVVAGSLTWEEWQDLAESQYQIPRATFARKFVILKKNEDIVKKNGLWEVS